MTSLEVLEDSEGKPLSDGFYIVNTKIPGLESPLVCVKCNSGNPIGKSFDGLQKAIGNGRGESELRADLLRKVNPSQHLIKLMQRYNAFIHAGKVELFDDELNKRVFKPLQNPLNDSEGKPLENGFYLVDLLIPGSASPLIYVRCENDPPMGMSFDGLQKAIGRNCGGGNELSSDLLRQVDPQRYFISLSKKYRTFIDSRGNEIFEEGSARNLKHS